MFNIYLSTAWDLYSFKSLFKLEVGKQQVVNNV